MKYIFYIFLFLSFNCFSQNTNCEDTNVICIPNYVGKEILIDLNRLDKVNALISNYKEEIIELNSKVDKLTEINKSLEETNRLSLKIVKNTEEKVKLFEEDNKNLRTEISNLKTKNTIIEIVAAGIIGGLTYSLTRK
jgi:hypothetical protein